MNAAVVTLLISTYNWEDALRLCLSSASIQTVAPSEIVIADDGSREETRKLIDEFRTILKVPIVHVWQEDNGFRLAAIRNKAIAQATGDYIIQIDGDVIMERHFIQDHIELMEKGSFICGSRTKLGQIVTSRLIKEVSLKPNVSELTASFVLNSFRSKTLRSFLINRYAKTISHMRGCNMAFWRDEFIAVNGYNEDLREWGHEDTELVYRLYFSGVNKKSLKMGGIVYHLWHKEASRNNLKAHLSILNSVKKNQTKWCDNGIDKYFK